jgi:serine/threonine protein phosphatase PrpC
VISEDGIDQLTEDHSFVAEAVKRGQSESEAMAGPWKDALTRSIGTEEDVQVDTFGPMPVPDNSAFVICSDGLYKALSDADVLRLYSQSSGPNGAAQALVSSALQNGSDDNISVAIVEFGEVRREMPGGTVPLDYTPEPRSTPAASGSPAGRPPGVGSGTPAALVAVVVLVAVALIAVLVFGIG